MIRLICAPLLLYLMLLALISCGQKQLTNAEQGKIDKVLHTVIGDEPRELDPQLATGSPESNILLSIFEGLTSMDTKTLEIQPAMAESWTVSEDKKVYRFKLREDLVWSNGDAISAYDIQWSWQRALMPNLASEWAYMKYYIKNAEAYNLGEIDDFSQVGISVIDDRTLEVELNYPTSFFLQLLAHQSYFPVPKSTVLKHGAMDQAVSPWTRPENFVGNGPFVVKVWEINNVIEVRKNPNYWDAKNIKLNGVNFYPISDKQAEERAFRSGQVHLTQTPQFAIEKIATYRNQNPEVLHINSTYSTYFYEFNVTKKPFDDVRVRRSIAMAIDRKTLTQQVTKAGETPAYSIVPTAKSVYEPEQYFKFDPEQAKKLLAEAGYPNGEGFPVAELLYNNDDNHRRVALAIQQMLKQHLNIEIELLNQEWKVYLNTKKNLNHTIARAGWIADYVDPSNFLELMYSTAGTNDTGWKNADYDRLIKLIQSTPDVRQRNALIEQANKMLSDAMPVVPLYNYADVNLVSTDVINWHGNAMHYNPYNRVDLKAPKAE